MNLESLDPNTLVGWLILAGVILGVFWKVGKWFNQVIDEMRRISGLVGEHEVAMVNQRQINAVFATKLNIPLVEIQGLERGK